MRVLSKALLMGLAFFAGAREGLADAPVGYSIADAKVTLLSKGAHGSKLYSLDVDALGPGTAFVLDNYGASRYELGYDMGLLIGDKIRPLFKVLKVRKVSLNLFFMKALLLQMECQVFIILWLVR